MDAVVAAAERGRGASLGPRHREGEIHEPVAFERRIERDVQEPALPLRVDDGRASHRRRDVTVPPHDAQVARPFGDEQPSVRQLVSRSSWSQSLKGILTAGLAKSVSYSSANLEKMFRGLK